MDTILNLGMNDTTVEIVAEKTGNPRFAYDSYRRFLQMYGDVVMGVQKRPGEDHEPFETVIETIKHERRGRAGQRTDASMRSRSSCRRSRTSSRSAPARASRRTRASSSRARSARCSVAG